MSPPPPATGGAGHIVDTTSHTPPANAHATATTSRSRLTSARLVGGHATRNRAGRSKRVSRFSQRTAEREEQRRPGPAPADRSPCRRRRGTRSPGRTRRSPPMTIAAEADHETGLAALPGPFRLDPQPHRRPLTDRRRQLATAARRCATTGTSPASSTDATRSPDGSSISSANWRTARLRALTSQPGGQPAPPPGGSRRASPHRRHRSCPRRRAQPTAGRGAAHTTPPTPRCGPARAGGRAHRGDRHARSAATPATAPPTPATTQPGQANEHQAADDDAATNGPGRRRGTVTRDRPGDRWRPGDHADSISNAPNAARPGDQGDEQSSHRRTSPLIGVGDPTLTHPAPTGARHPRPASPDDSGCFGATVVRCRVQAPQLRSSPRGRSSSRR